MKRKQSWKIWQWSESVSPLSSFFGSYKQKIKEFLDFLTRALIQVAGIDFNTIDQDPDASRIIQNAHKQRRLNPRHYIAYVELNLNEVINQLSVDSYGNQRGGMPQTLLRQPQTPRIKPRMSLKQKSMNDLLENGIKNRMRYAKRRSSEIPSKSEKISTAYTI